MSEHLKNSFSNVKKDMLHLHQTVSTQVNHTNKKFSEIDERMRRIEFLLHSNLRKNQEPERTIIQEPEKKDLEVEQVEEIETTEDAAINLLKSLPRAELKLFKALHELQNSLKAKHISYKSLANYIYPGKEYNSIRSTITQFILRLNTEGLVDKQRIGREAYAKITPHGFQSLKSAKIQKIIKDLEVNE